MEDETQMNAIKMSHVWSFDRLQC